MLRCFYSVLFLTESKELTGSLAIDLGPKKYLDREIQPSSSKTHEEKGTPANFAVINLKWPMTLGFDHLQSVGKEFEDIESFIVKCRFLYYTTE